ncbi:MAG: SLC13 family permease, partial [Bacteroidetes bacterium]|nr:SLC13 family permease [Bacteroidota bacterium]
AVVATMFLLVALEVLPLVTAAFAAAIVMVVSRCVTGTEARRSVNLQVLIIIAAALGIGQAFVRTGLADALAQGILAASASLGVIAVLALLYVVTNVLTEIVANAAAAALMLPIALSTAATLGIDPKALAVIVTIGAAASFVTPIGYQTNLMVMAAGSYRFRDYVKVGAPASLLVMIVSVTVTYLVWIQ